MKSEEQFYERDQLVLWGLILEEWLQVRDRYAIIPPSMDHRVAKKMIEARQLADELVEKLKNGRSSVMKDPSDIESVEEMLAHY